MRVIVTPAVLPPEALAELKQWLAISTTLDDGPLGVLLRGALDICAEFTGRLPIACGCEEILRVTRRFPMSPVAAGPMTPEAIGPLCLPPEWQELASRPVLSLTGVAGVLTDGSRVAITPDGYEYFIGADGDCHIRLINRGSLYRYAVAFTAGLAPDWASLPVPLRHGIIRLAAHQHRTREGVWAEPLPPASVAALWRPWRRVRLT